VPMNVWISADMEGISGILAEDDLDRGRYDYDRGRDRMTADVDAAVRGAFDGGAQTVTVTDSHGAMRNLVIEDLDPRAELIQGMYTPWVMAEGLQERPDVAFLIGYHGRAGSGGVLSHTWSSRHVYDVRVDGVSIGELGLVAAAAGHHGVPVALVVGDDVCCAEAAAFLPGVEQVVTKRAVNRAGARMRHPAPIREELAAAARSIVERGSDVAPFTFPDGARVEIEWLSKTVAGVATLVPGVSGDDARTTTFTAADSLELLRTFILLTTLAGGVDHR
jgi:D-amino peptidase